MNYGNYSVVVDGKINKLEYKREQIDRVALKRVSVCVCTLLGLRMETRKFILSIIN